MLIIWPWASQKVTLYKDRPDLCLGSATPPFPLPAAAAAAAAAAVQVEDQKLGQHDAGSKQSW